MINLRGCIVLASLGLLAAAFWLSAVWPEATKGDEIMEPAWTYEVPPRKNIGSLNGPCMTSFATTTANNIPMLISTPCTARVGQ